MIDLHAHTSGISKCCRISAHEVLKRTLDSGLDGIVLTNHYQKSYIKDGDVDRFAKRYIEEYYNTRKLGDQMGCKVFYGIEVTIELYPNVHMLIYGVGESFLEKYPTVYDLTQEELYRIVKEEDGILIQAHPFRNGTKVLDVNFMDGIEINCHPLYKYTYSAELIEIADKSGLVLTCGGDYHADTYRPRCGTYLPEETNSSYKVGQYLRTTEQIRLCVHEFGADVPVDIEYRKKLVR